LLTDERSREAIKVAEQYIEGGVSRKMLDAAKQSACDAFDDACFTSVTSTECREAARAVGHATIVVEIKSGEFRPDAWIWAAEDTAWTVRHAIGWDNGSIHAELLRELFGSLPFRSFVPDPGWLVWKDYTVPKLAQVIYDDRAFDRLPILADALEEAGCDNADILDHCRQPGMHVRGCWVTDLILGKK
jgi:hypothetical protein